MDSTATSYATWFQHSTLKFQRSYRKRYSSSTSTLIFDLFDAEEDRRVMEMKLKTAIGFLGELTHQIDSLLILLVAECV